MRGAITFTVVLFVACSSGGRGPTTDAGLSDAGACCPRSPAPGPGSCGPVLAGGFSFAGSCKQKMISACTRVRSGIDLHNCPIWIEDGPCDCDAGNQCPSDFVEYDITGYQPAPMHAPRAPSHACTTQEISDFAACHTGDTSKCTAGDASTCATCLISQPTDTEWGPFVAAYEQWNSGGCADLVLGQTALEPTSCGTKLDALRGCVTYACAGCAALSFEQDTCDEAAIQGPCVGFEQQTSPACDALTDAGADVCFPNPTITDPVARQKDFVTRIATYFCGP